MSVWKAYTLVLILLLIGLAEGKILVSIPELKSLAERISGEEVESLIPSSVDPHYVSISYRELKKVEEAEVVLLANSWLIPFEAELKQNCLRCLDFENYNATLLEFPGIGKNPHAYWLLPENALKIANALKKKLSEIEPKRAEELERNYEDFKKSLELAEKDAKKLVSNVKDYEFIAMDPHTAYAVSALGLKVSYAFPEEIAPSAFEIENLKAEKCVFVIADYQEESKLGEIAKQMAVEKGCGIAKVKVISELSFESQLLANAVSLSNPQFEAKGENSLIYLLSLIAVCEAIALVVLWRLRRRI